MRWIFSARWNRSGKADRTGKWFEAASPVPRTAFVGSNTTMATGGPFNSTACAFRRSGYFPDSPSTIHNQGTT